MKSIQFYVLAILIMEAPHINESDAKYIGWAFIVMICCTLLLQFITKKEL